MRFINSCIMIGNLLFTLPVLGWSAAGHRVTGQIAYDHMHPAARRYFAHMNQTLNTRHHHFNLISASVWLDLFYNQQLISLRPVHYIDIPYVVDIVPESPGYNQEYNALQAIKEATFTLEDPHAPLSNRAVALRILLHVIGDIHQPLHTTTRVSALHPHGDRGGNDFKLSKNEIGDNLHRYWDRGGGLLPTTRLSTASKQLARTIESEADCPPEDLDPMHWISESHQLAITHAYLIEEKSVPSESYQQDTQMICKQQLLFAGCRLAALLNHIYQTQ